MSRRRVIVCLLAGAVATAGLTFAEPPIAEVSYFGTSVEFSPKAWGHGFILRVKAPDGSVVEKTIRDGVPRFDLSELEGQVVNGRYKYELHPIVSSPRGRRDIAEMVSGAKKQTASVQTLSGSFLVANGSIVSREASATKASSSGLFTPRVVPDAPDHTIKDDLCAGSDCDASETFHVQATIKLKEADTGIQFEDTSASGWPTNDWLIHANDNTQSGSDYLAIRDLTASTTPFTVEAGAPDNSLYLDSAGNVGIGTSLPTLDLHITSGDAPAIVFHQDESEGWPLQSWRLSSTEVGFFFRDMTYLSYPMAIATDAPWWSLFIGSDGKIGLGTQYPSYAVEVERSGVNSAVVVDRTDGATNYINATAYYGNFGTVTDHPLRLAVNSAWQMRINNDSSILMANGASLTAGGVWTDASSRELKKDVKSLSIEKATAALSDLDPVEFAFKANGERHVGFIAEDVPELVAGADRNGLSPMDVVAVLTRILQEQREIVEAHKRALQEQQEINNQLLARISVLESR